VSAVYLTTPPFPSGPPKPSVHATDPLETNSTPCAQPQSTSSCSRTPKNTDNAAIFASVRHKSSTGCFGLVYTNKNRQVAKMCFVKIWADRGSTKNWKKFRVKQMKTAHGLPQRKRACQATSTPLSPKQRQNVANAGFHRVLQRVPQRARPVIYSSPSSRSPPPQSPIRPKHCSLATKFARWCKRGKMNCNEVRSLVQARKDETPRRVQHSRQLSPPRTRERMKMTR